MVQRDRTWSNMVQRGGEGEAFAYPASSAMMYCSDRKWSNVVQSDPWWSNMAESVPGWSNLVQVVRRWSDNVEHGPTLSNMVQLGPTSERSGFLSNKSTHIARADRIFSQRLKGTSFRFIPGLPSTTRCSTVPAAMGRTACIGYHMESRICR